MHVALTSSEYDRLVWRPDWRVSICFLACARDTLRTDKASKMPLRRELRTLEHGSQREISS